MPIFNSPVKIATSCLTGRRGTAGIHATFHTAAPASMTHSGVGANGAPVGGVNIGAIGTDLCAADIVNLTRLEVGPGLNFVRIQNLNAFAAAVVVEMVW
jgi:hypothetical protein